MIPCFFTVCDGSLEDYEFLLGSIEHHAEMGHHLVLDTTPIGKAKTFSRLPKSVKWVHQPIYGSGWKSFRFVSALKAAMAIAIEEFDPDVLVKLDADDFFEREARGVFALALDSILKFQYVHWMTDGNPYIFGDSEWHQCAWPGVSDVSVELDPEWPKSRTYNGNPHTHPRVANPQKLPVVKVNELYRHHTHFALGRKAQDDEIAKHSITGWPHAKTLISMRPWPARLWRWRTSGVLPSESFQ